MPAVLTPAFLSVAYMLAVFLYCSVVALSDVTTLRAPAVVLNPSSLASSVAVSFPLVDSAATVCATTSEDAVTTVFFSETMNFSSRSR